MKSFKNILHLLGGGGGLWLTLKLVWSDMYDKFTKEWEKKFFFLIFEHYVT